MKEETRDLRDWFRQHRLQWGLALVVGLWLLRIAGNYAWRRWFGTIDIHETLPFALFLLGGVLVGSVGLTGGGIVWLTGTSWRELGWRRDGLAKAIGLGLVGFVLSTMAMMALLVIERGAPSQSYVRPTVVRVLLVAVFAFGYAPWIEENLFRGYLQPVLAGRAPLWAAVAIQAAIFAASHLGYATSVLQYAWLFVSGVIYGVLRGRDRSLVAPYLAHALGWMMVVFGPPAF